MSYNYISIHHSLASEVLINICANPPNETRELVTYYIDLDIFDSSNKCIQEGVEYMCQSSDEFIQKVKEVQLVKLLG